MVSSAEPLRQRLPVQDLSRLTLISAQPKKVAEWVATLPMVNVGESARQVYLTIQEVNRLRIDEGARFQLLEALRPTVHYLCQALAKHYLNQSVVLPEKATKVATLAQAMQNHLANGYKLVVVNTLDKLAPGSRRDAEPVKLLGFAIHRAISDLTGTLLRSCQLYLHTPARLWLELHCLYLIADSQQITNTIKVKESYPRYQEQSSIEEAYVRALLLATCKPNKLRQQEIAQVYELSELWAALINLRSLSYGDELFVFDLGKDAPPTYRSLGRAGEAGEFRAIDPHGLVERLEAVLKDPQLGNPRARGEAALSTALIHHLIQAWSELTERSFQRIAHDGQLELCLGLTATHYFLAGSVGFEKLLHGATGKNLISTDDNLFLKDQNPVAKRDDERGKSDIWSKAYGSPPPAMNEKGDFKFNFGNIPEPEPEADAEEQELYDRYFCQIVNISPGGYCIEWTGVVPGTVKAGELVGLREDGHPDWSLGVIRWVRQIPGHGAQLGMEVLAPKATPCGARVIKKTGDSTEFMRTLLLPELKALNRSATLITPNLTFRPGYRIVLMLDGGEEKALLTNLLSTTQSFCQFEFQFTRKPQEAAPSEAEKPTPAIRDDEDFDTIWSSL
jgi:hypothetical protein